MSKLSARSSGELSLNNTPSKSSSFKNHTALFSTTPIRVGEMEFTSFLLTKDMNTVLRYLAQNSNNPEERRNFIKALLTHNNIFDIEKIEKIKDNKTKSITGQIVKTQLMALGIENVDNRTKEKNKDKEVKSDKSNDNN
jgi:hypothetical protein